MRKLVVSMNLSLDGYMSGPNCELDWHFESWTREMGVVLCDQLSQADTILFGRTTYNGMSKYWQMKAEDPACSSEDFAFASMMNSYAKIVFSRSVTVPEWSNSSVAKGNIVTKVNRLKEEPGRDIIIYGSGKVVRALMKVVDEYHLWLHPVALGKGKPLFDGLLDKLRFKLESVQQFDSGVVLIVYKKSIKEKNL